MTTAMITTPSTSTSSTLHHTRWHGLPPHLHLHITPSRSLWDGTVSAAAGLGTCTRGRLFGGLTPHGGVTLVGSVASTPIWSMMCRPLPQLLMQARQNLERALLQHMVCQLCQALLLVVTTGNHACNYIQHRQEGGGDGNSAQE